MQRLWRCTNQRGYSLSQKRISPLEPQEKGFDIASKQLEELQCLPTALPIARRCRVWCCYTTWPTSTTRCRSAHLVFVQPNHLLSAIHIVLVMRTAASEAMPPWQAIASLCKSEVDGDCVRLTTRRQSDSEDRSKSNRLDIKQGRHLIRQALQFFELLACNVRPFSWGFKGAILFCEREWPPCPRPPARRGEQGAALCAVEMQFCILFTAR